MANLDLVKIKPLLHGRMLTRNCLLTMDKLKNGLTNKINDAK